MKKTEIAPTNWDIQKQILPFIKDLQANNNRDWFNTNKPQYLAIKEHLTVFTTECIEKIKLFDPEINDVSAKKSMFRIYRDTRFSHDKTPYKNHIGIFISKGGSHGECSGYYIHFEPGKSFMGAGVYGLSPESIKKIRQEIYFKSEEFKKIINDPKIVKQFGSLDEEAKMKMAPKGFDKNFPDMDLLKYRNYFLATHISDSEIEKATSVDKIVDLAKILVPFGSFLNRALSF